jgi:hypothetical protein
LLEAETIFPYTKRKGFPMKKHKTIPFVALFVALIFSPTIVVLLPNVAYTEEEVDQGCRCLEGLQKLEQLIGENRPDLDLKAVKGVWGLEWRDSLRPCGRRKIGKLSDLRYCKRQVQVDIMLKIYFGIIDESVIEDYPKCWSAFGFLIGSFEQRYGSETSSKLGRIIGDRFAETASVINGMLPKVELNVDDIMEKGNVLFGRLGKMPQQDRRKTMDEYCRICETYNIPIEAYFRGAFVHLK